MEWLICLFVGTAVVLFGLWFLKSHSRTIHRFETDKELSEKQRNSLVAQHKRRRIATGLLIIVGVLIPASYYATSVVKNPLAASLILLMILVLIAIIVLFAIGDILAGRMVREDLDLKKAEAELKRRILEQELAKHQSLKENYDTPKKTAQ